MEGLNIAPDRESSRIFDRIAVLGDPIRCRILLLLENHELAVSELCRILQLPQSTVSRHLKALTDDGWIQARREGTSRRYSATPDPIDKSAERLWHLLREEISDGNSARQDRGRLAEVLARRRTRSQEFFSSAASEWDEMRRNLFGDRFDLEGLMGLLEEDWVVGDLGCGTGRTTRSLAQFVRTVIAVDESEAMLNAARDRLTDLDNIELRSGCLEQLPISDSTLDAALLVMVLHHLADPSAVLAEARRALKPQAKLLIVDMLPHDREEYRQQMGHIWLGFTEREMRSRLAQTGFDKIRFHPLRAAPEVMGPNLFTATARVAESLAIPH